MNEAKQKRTLRDLIRDAQTLLDKAPPEPYKLPTEAETWICNVTEFLDTFIIYAKRTIRD